MDKLLGVEAAMAAAAAAKVGGAVEGWGEEGEGWGVKGAPPSACGRSHRRLDLRSCET